MSHSPEILAPAGDMPSALSALAAGADAVYLGLKHFSARMAADNFANADLARLVDLAHREQRKIYVAMNTFFKPGEEVQVARLIKRMMLGPHPDAIIAQDPAIVLLARDVGFEGEIHLSTLANVTHQTALESAARLGAQRAVLPRELSIDEIRTLSENKPKDLALEIFVHGALCYCVSGRCWWSSYMGGKSGLRGRCVQPCRRVYKQGGREGRFFSCRDLSIDVLAKTLLEMPGVNSWKIEGRKKGPHYVYHVVTAYRLLRDHAGDPGVKKEAEELLTMSLGRPTTRSNFLPQKNSGPTAYGALAQGGPGSKDSQQTTSGLLCGKISHDGKGPVELKTRMELLPKDYLRIGYEDESWHQTLPVTRRIPKNGALTLKISKHKTPKNGTPVFLIDRREPELEDIIKEWQVRLDAMNPKLRKEPRLMEFQLPPLQRAKHARPLEISLRSSLPRGRSGKDGIKPGTVQGLWLSPKAMSDISGTLYGRISWWLPPVIWPNEEGLWQKLIRQALRGGARHFVCNAPWQEAYFSEKHGLSLTAGPFCNITNAHAVEVMAHMGFSSVILSPELSGEDYMHLPANSPLPLGLVISGYWPMGLTRHGVEPLKHGEILTSPKQEGFWSKRYGQNVWLFPAWPLDLQSHRPELDKAGFSTFVHMDEHAPKGLTNTRTSEFNWKIGVL